MESQPVPVQEPRELEPAVDEGDPLIIFTFLQKRLAGREIRSFLGGSPIWGRRGSKSGKRESEEEDRDNTR